ncbi:hypothetical protein J6590_103945, partial [Homalodisca vitripennis]
FFPVPGHSFLPCDRDFGIISKALRRHDRLFTPEEVKEVIEKSSSIPAFTMINGIICHNFFMSKTKLVFPPTEPAYPQNKVPIKQAKLEDILKLKEYIPDVYSAFYNEVFQWLTTTNNQGPDSDYEIETDNEIEEH